MEESWKQIEGYHYSVSQDGRIRNDKTDKEKALRLNRYGYPVVDLYKYGKRKHCQVHRLVADAYIPNPDNKPQINHKDGIKTNNNIQNLEWATAKENMRHCVDNNLYTVNHGMLGKHNPNAGRHGKPIRIVETGEEFESTLECCRKKGFDDTGIYSVLSGERKTHRNLHFEYV